MHPDQIPGFMSGIFLFLAVTSSLRVDRARNHKNLPDGIRITRRVEW
ncbi:hypothetical protein [Stenomitos frigidus]|nr:hypothetical protein [Stenomitos frigidus]